MKKRLINNILKNSKVYKDIKRKIIALDIYNPEFCIDKKYFYIKNWEKLHNLSNEKISMRIFNL